MLITNTNTEMDLHDELSDLREGRDIICRQLADVIVAGTESDSADLSASARLDVIGYRRRLIDIDAQIADRQRQLDACIVDWADQTVCDVLDSYQHSDVRPFDEGLVDAPMTAALAALGLWMVHERLGDVSHGAVAIERLGQLIAGEMSCEPDPKAVTVSLDDLTPVAKMVEIFAARPDSHVNDSGRESIARIRAAADAAWSQVR